MALPRLKQRREFLRVAGKGKRAARPSVLLQALPETEGPLRVGFTATKKLGNAVVRNRAKRRLREAARALLPQHGVPGSDYVFIARMGTTERAWDRLLDDVKSTLTRLATPKADRPSHARAPSGQDRQNP